MRQITRDIIAAFKAGKEKKINNSYTNGKSLYLWGNKIAEFRGNELWISNAGWFTKTTRDRLEGLGARIYQKNWIWYLNGEQWDGNWIKLNG